MSPRDRAVAAACVSLAISVIRIVGVIKEEKRKRAYIQAEGVRNMEAIKYAAAEVNKNINKGEYDSKGLPAVVSDLQFYQIAHRVEKG